MRRGVDPTYILPAVNVEIAVIVYRYFQQMKTLKNIKIQTTQLIYIIIKNGLTCRDIQGVDKVMETPLKLKKNVINTVPC